MKYGFVLPEGDARTAANLAEVAENAGWDGFFVVEPVWGIDAWVALTAAAMSTERIKLGTMLTPLPRRKPWDLAGQTAALDNLSGGRVILSVGMGAVHDGWTTFERDEGKRTRAEKLDEGWDLLNGLWSGTSFGYSGKHYQVHQTNPTVPPPLQRPRITTWVVGAWPRPKSMRRVLRYDGWLPNYLPYDGSTSFTPAILSEATSWIAGQRERGVANYDVVIEGNTYEKDEASARRVVSDWAAAGATWWLEANWSLEEDVTTYAQRRLAVGPPRIN